MKQGRGYFQQGEYVVKASKETSSSTSFFAKTFIIFTIIYSTNTYIRIAYVYHGRMCMLKGANSAMPWHSCVFNCLENQPQNHVYKPHFKILPRPVRTRSKKVFRIDFQNQRSIEIIHPWLKFSKLHWLYLTPDWRPCISIRSIACFSKF